MFARLFLLFTFVLSINLSSLAAEPYKVGVILPLSGKIASLGVYIKKGIDLAYQELNDDERNKIKLYFEDDQFEARQTVSAYQKLKAQHNIDAVLTVGSTAGNVLGPIAEKDKKLMISIGASDKKFAAGTDYIFTHWVSPEAESSVMAAEIQKRDYKHIAGIINEQEGAIALNDAFIEEMKQKGISDLIVMQEKFLMDNTDYRTFISKAKAKNVDGVYAVLFPAGLGTFAKQAREAGLDADIFGFELFEDEHAVEASDGALIGQWYVNADDAGSEYAKRFKAKYNEEPGWASANAYDSLSLIKNALMKYGSDNLKISNYLKSVKNYSGAIGTYSATGDNRFELPATVKVVAKDGFKKLY